MSDVIPPATLALVDQTLAQANDELNDVLQILREIWTSGDTPEDKTAPVFAAMARAFARNPEKMDHNRLVIHLAAALVRILKLENGEQ